MCFTFQPVALKVFPALPTVTVRSHIPGRLAAKNTKLLMTSAPAGLQVHPAELCLTDLYVFGSIVGEPLVHFIAEAQQIVFKAQVGDHLELLLLVNLQMHVCVPNFDAQCSTLMSKT